jgi:hypothetical protein
MFLDVDGAHIPLRARPGTGRRSSDGHGTGSHGEDGNPLLVIQWPDTDDQIVPGLH